jgi:hypothetical protein
MRWDQHGHEPGISFSTANWLWCPGQVLLEGLLEPADLGKEALVSAVLQSFTAAGSHEASAAAALLLAKLTPGAKHLGALQVMRLLQLTQACV